MSKIRCSVPILTLNSEKHLARCLESIKDFEDVFIVDGNSTDGTRAIAERYGIPVYKQVESDEPNVRISNFTEVRSRAYDRARTDWVLVLDSDEYITKELRDSIEVALLEHGNEANVGFLIEKKMVIAGKEIDHAFMREITVRLYNRKSGIGYITGKLVHEKLHIPDGVRQEMLKGVFYSEEASSYTAGVAKDSRYLSLMQKKVLEKRSKNKRDVWLITQSIYTNFFRAFKILFASCLVYVRHGYARSLPFSQVLRYVRYHLLLSVIRTKQLFFNLFSSR